MTDTYGLRPCPMCGSRNLKHYTTESVQSFRRGTVKCLDCGCMVRAEGGGHELFGELGLAPNNDGRYGRLDYEIARAESNDRAYRLSAKKWNGVGDG